MQEDSLLSNLSNVSYHGKDHSFNGADFFDKSLPVGEVASKKKNSNHQMEVNINDLGLNSSIMPMSPQHNLLAGALHWTGGNQMLLQGQSQNGSQYEMQNNNNDYQSHLIRQKDEENDGKQDKKLNQNNQNEAIKKNVILITKKEENFMKCNSTQKVMGGEAKMPMFEKFNKRKKSIRQIGTQNDKRVKKQGDSEYQNSEQKERNRMNSSSIKNETKNIPKNYGKAIITYIQKYRSEFENILQEEGITYQQFLDEVSLKKKSINTIANLRQLWIDFKYSKSMRALSNQFLRKHALHYIFNSRICNYTSHIKYRKRLQEAIENPTTFKHIKQY